MLRALTFDFWGTLYQNAYAREERLDLLSNVLNQHGQSRPLEELEAAVEHAKSAWEEVWQREQRSISIDRWLDEFLGQLGVTLPSEASIELGHAIQSVYLHTDKPRPVAGVRGVLADLADRYRLGLISDTGLTPGRVLREVMRGDDLLSHFDVLTFSDELGTAKPRPEPFLHTLGELEALPNEAAHIGDLPETDLQGARNVGMKAVLFLGVSHREDGLPLADAAFADYSELDELLEELE